MGAASNSRKKRKKRRLKGKDSLQENGERGDTFFPGLAKGLPRKKKRGYAWYAAKGNLQGEKKVGGVGVGRKY